MQNSAKPETLQKKQPQKTPQQRRSEKRAPVRRRDRLGGLITSTTEPPHETRPE
jgi:hypothetical protein